MAVTWTREQQMVIDLRERNLLVSAAAGSGKTAVLVERIITRLTKDPSPIDVDQLLVVTYTEAAAAEMKERIGAALEKALLEQPGNAHLKKQAALLHTAKIMTIHSFCLSVIREYFHTIDLDPGFRIVEEGELKLLKQDVLEQLLEAKYEEAEEDFLQFVESFATGRDDVKLEELILMLYEYAGSDPDPEKWLEACAKVYQEGLSSDALFMKKLMIYLKNCLTDLEQNLEYAKEICCESDGPEAYLQTIEKDELLLEEILNAENYEELHRAFTHLDKWPRLASNKDKSVDEEKIALVKQLRDDWKATISELKKNYFAQSIPEMEEDMRICLPVMNMLIRLVKEFGRLLAEKKEERNVIDFHDMEQFALKILTRKENGQFVPSEAAKDYQNQFEEIMIDEYQDSNLLQETILSSVSRMSLGVNNLFMVGDVKQSIYRFRLSRPELFMEKFDRYVPVGEEEEALGETCQRIDLHKNFRSRAEVLNATNAIFRQIMTKKLGQIVYDKDAALYVGAEYPPQEGNQAEILVIDTEREEEKESASLKTEEARDLEIRAIAGRIHSLMEEQKVLDKKTGTLRPLKYGDIVILARSLRGYADSIPKIMGEEGIPVYAQSREGYFETLEIGWILDYLRVLDNYRQDVPLAAVLKSPFGKCTNEELAQIKSAWPEVPFSEAVLRTAGIWWQEVCKPDAEISEVAREKIQGIFQKLEDYRRQISYLSIHELLWKIMKETGYRDYVSAMPGGEQRAANLDMLLMKAKAFESTSYKGLFHFVRYMEQLKKYEMDLGEAGIFDEQMEAVRLMSIHKSKGLEFPVVIVAGMGKKFNTQDLRGSVVMHPDLGLGIDAIDLEHRTRSQTLLKSAIKCENKLENLGEELRVLYVALTRAKEKLILAGTYAKAEKKLEVWNNAPQKDTLSFSELSSASCYFDWVLPAAVHEMRAPLDLRLMKVEDIVEEEILREEADLLDKRLFLKTVEEEQGDAEFAERLKEQFSYRYPERSEQVKLKYSVSELKKRAAFLEEREELGEELVKEEVPTPYVPAFIEETSTPLGAARGSVYHKVMELLDFTQEYDEIRLKEQMDAWVREGYLTEEMRGSVKQTDILCFLKSSLGQRMMAAAVNGRLYKEQPFVLGVDAEEIYPDSEMQNTVLIQGIIDVFFEEDGEYVILDYKTDKVRQIEELVVKYQEQLHLYGKAVEQISQKKVKERIIYSFTLKEECVL